MTGLAALALALAVNAQTAAPGPRVITLAECVALALDKNLDIQIRRLQPSIDLYNLDATRGYYDLTFNLNAAHRFNASPGSPDPNSALFNRSSDSFTESYGPSFTQQLGTGGRVTLNGDLIRRSGSSFTSYNYSSDAGLSFTQPLLKNAWIDSTRQTILVNKRTLKINELALRNQVMTTVTSVQQAYYELVFARDNVRVQAASLELAEKLAADNKRRVEVGALAPLDEKQSESQVAARRSDLLSARRDLEIQVNNLKNLIGDDFGAWATTALEPADKLLAVAQTLNVQVNIRMAVESIWFDDAKSGNFDIALGVIISTLLDPSDYFNAWYKTDGPQNHSFWSNPKFDALLGQIDREVDATKRKALIREADMIMESDPPLLPICWEKINDGSTGHPASIGYSKNNGR